MHIPSLDEIRKFSLLEDIHGASLSAGRTFVCPYNVLTGLMPSETDEYVGALIEEGLLRKDDDVILKVALTDEGKALIHYGTYMRQTPSVFRGVVRERLLAWVAEHSENEEDYIEVGMDNRESWYYGREITMSDLESAAAHLEQHGLLSCKKNDDGPALLLSITESGKTNAHHFDGAAEMH